MRQFLTLTRHSREPLSRRARRRRLITGGNDMGALKEIVLPRPQMMRLQRLVIDARNAVLAGMQENETTKISRGEGMTAIFDGSKNAEKMMAARGWRQPGRSIFTVSIRKELPKKLLAKLKKT